VLQHISNVILIQIWVLFTCNIM